MTYYERRFDGVRSFKIDGHLLRISGKRSLRSEFDSVIDLRAVAPQFSVLLIRHKTFFTAFLMLVFSVGIGVVLYAMRVSNGLVIMSGAFVVALVLMAVTYRKQKFFQFAYKSGPVAFDVCQAGPQSAQTQSFVDGIVAVISDVSKSSIVAELGGAADGGGI